MAARRVPWLVGSPWGLLLAFLLTVAVPLAIFALLVLREAHDALMRQALERQSLNARYAALVISERLGGELRYVSGEAESPVLSDALARRDLASVQAYLLGMMMEHGAFERAFVTDARGRLVDDQPRTSALIGRDLSSQSWFRGVVRQRAPYIADFYARLLPPHREVFSIAAPLRDARGAVRGYLVLQEPVSALLASVAPAAKREGRMLVIVDSLGLAYFSQGQLRPLGDRPIVRRALKGGTGQGLANVPFAGGVSMYAYAHVDSTGWSVFSVEPTAVALAPARALSRTMFWFALATLVGVCAIGAYWLTAVNRYQANLIAVEGELRRSRDELEGVSYSLSHDLRTPLRGIDGFSQLLIEDYGAQLDANGRDYLRRVREASQRMGRLLDDFVRLLSVSRAPVAREPTDLSALAREAIAALRAAMPTREVAVSVQEGLVAEGDPRLLRLVLEDLLSNAWKFTRTRTPARIDVTGERQADALVLCVEDNGIGFEMTYADKLFKPFQKLHAPEEELEGSGMGLAIVQRVVERHGGRVWATGNPGVGARFCFTLPYRAPAPLPDEA